MVRLFGVQEAEIEGPPSARYRSAARCSDDQYGKVVARAMEKFVDRVTH